MFLTSAAFWHGPEDRNFAIKKYNSERKQRNLVNVHMKSGSAKFDTVHERLWPLPSSTDDDSSQAWPSSDMLASVHGICHLLSNLLNEKDGHQSTFSQKTSTPFEQWSEPSSIVARRKVVLKICFSAVIKPQRKPGKMFRCSNVCHQLC